LGTKTDERKLIFRFIAKKGSFAMKLGIKRRLEVG